MFRWFKSLKKLKKSEKAHNGAMDIDESGRLIIDIKLEDPSNAYNEFSPMHDLRINPSLIDYIEAENSVSKHPLGIKVYSGALFADESAQQVLTATLKKTFDDRRHQNYNRIRFCNFRTLTSLIAGLLILLLCLSVQYISKGENLFLSSMEILSWVFVWEAADLFFFERPSLSRSYLHSSKLSAAKIEFVK